MGRELEKAKSEMIKCLRCRTDNYPTFSFCGVCATPIAPGAIAKYSVAAEEQKQAVCGKDSGTGNAGKR